MTDKPKKFSVCAMSDGWAVTSRHATGALVAIADYPTREGALRKAERLNEIDAIVHLGRLPKVLRDLPELVRAARAASLACL